MASDVDRQRAVLFGGFAGSQVIFGDTWEWDGSTWMQRSLIGGPPRGGGVMAYDSMRRKSVLFGVGSSYPYDSTVWEWDGTTWNGFAPIPRPTGRVGTAITYDAARGRSVYYGGYFVHPQVGPIYLGDTGEWDGSSWTFRGSPPNPRSRSGAAISYFPPRRSIILFGGYVDPTGYSNETWEYTAINPATFTSFGAGCAGSGGTPSLQADGDSLPWLGDTFRAELTNLGTNTQLNLPFVLLGDSRTAWGNLSLPLDLGLIGMPTCTLYANPLLVFPLPNVGGRATWPVSVPYDPSYVGLSLFAQGGVTSPGANALGVVVSNAGELKLGEK
jgi:hypothetical protein